MVWPTSRRHACAQPGPRALATIRCARCALAGTTVEAVCAEYEGRMFSSFKPALAELAVSVLGPIAAEMRRLMDEPGHIDAILADGAARATAMAGPILAEVHRLMGLGR